MKFLTHCDLNKNELRNAVLQPLATAPESPRLGQVYFDTTDSCIKQYDGSTWERVGVVYSAENDTAKVITGLGEAGEVIVTDIEDLTLEDGTTLGEKLAEIEDAANATNAVTALTATAVQTDETVLGDIANPKKNDIATVSRVITGDLNSVTAYVYDGEKWVAADGNYNAENVYFDEDITLAGDYTSVGNIAKSEGTLSAAGKSIKEVLTSIFLKRLQPEITSEPAVTTTLTDSGSKEVGTTFTPSWSATLSTGAYTYGEDAGVRAKSWSVKDSNGNTSTESSGSFPAFVVTDDTSYKVTASATYDAGNVAIDNLGDASDPTIQIAGGSKSASSGTVTGHRNWYMYIGTDNTSDIDSTFIRGTTSKGNGKNASTQGQATDGKGVAIPGGTKRIMIAIPAGTGYTKKLTNVVDIDGMGLSVFSNFTPSTVSVAGASDSVDAMNYNIWVAENANGYAATEYQFVIG